VDITLNSIVEENIIVCQPEKGFRFSVDSIYLAWFVRYRKNSAVLDIGSGSGVISALLGYMKKFERIDALELQPEMFRCLKETVERSELQNVVSTLCIDINKYNPNRVYDIVVSNPPYRSSASGRVPEDNVELNARFTTTMHVEDVFRFSGSYLKNSGSLYLSYDADLLADLFEAGARYGLEPKKLMPVCPDINVKPKIVLMEFRKNTGREMNFEAPLYQKINGEQSELDEKIMTGKWFE